MVFFAVEKHATFCKFFNKIDAVWGGSPAVRRAGSIGGYIPSVSLRPLVEQSLHRRLFDLSLFGIQERHCDLFVRQNPEQMDGRPFAAREPFFEISRSQNYRL